LRTYVATDGVTTATVRRAAALFSARAYRPVLRGQRNQDLEECVHWLRPRLGLSAHAANGEVIDHAYQLLARSYMPEYVYKNLITSKIFVGRHRASTTVMLNEFRVGSAVADAVLVNGEAAAYEIKTELDNPDKLTRQLAQYYKAFPRVYVVTHHSIAARYEARLEGTPAGVISVGSRLRLSTAKPSELHTEDLSVLTMFNALRVDETRFALSALGLGVPEVPNGLRYQRYLERAMQAPAIAFHGAFRTALSGRTIAGDRSLYLDPTLLPLRSILLQLDPSPSEGDRLRVWLEREE